MGGSVAVLLLVAGLILSPAGEPVRGVFEGSGGPKRAAIVDQLSLTVANPQFIQETTDLLKSDGYEVDYYKGEDVTVDLYRTLPERDYDLVLLRVHSTAIVSRGEEDVTSVSLFTGQSYSRDLYYEEQLQGRVGFAQYTEDGPKFFGITSDFVRNSMKGTFDDTVVLMMGCRASSTTERGSSPQRRPHLHRLGRHGVRRHTDDATELLPATSSPTAET